MISEPPGELARACSSLGFFVFWVQGLGFWLGHSFIFEVRGAFKFKRLRAPRAGYAEVPSASARHQYRKALKFFPSKVPRHSEP